MASRPLVIPQSYGSNCLECYQKETKCTGPCSEVTLHDKPHVTTGPLNIIAATITVVALKLFLPAYRQLFAPRVATSTGGRFVEPEELRRRYIGLVDSFAYQIKLVLLYNFHVRNDKDAIESLDFHLEEVITRMVESIRVDRNPWMSPVVYWDICNEVDTLIEDYITELYNG